MDLLQVVLQGLLEGLTEFIPVSSTGHLILLANVLGEHGDKEKLFEVFIQLGAILAVSFIYFKKLLRIVKDIFRSGLGGLSKEGSYKGKTIGYDSIDIILACIPPLIAGFLFYKYIKSLLFYPVPVACALIFGGLGLILVEQKKMKDLDLTSGVEKVTRKQAFIVGLFQCLALWPGMSRSGSCIIGGRLSGLSRVLSAEFSFIVAIPIMTAAVAYDVYKSYSLLELGDLSYFALGFFLAFVSGGLAVKGFISYLERFSLVPFGIYRIVLGILVLIYFA